MPIAKPAFFETEKRAFGRYGLEPSARVLQVGDPPLSLRVLESGVGDPVVCLHGISLASAHWAPIIARLESNRCIMVDMPGHGGSGAVNFTGVDLRSWHSDILTGVLDQLGLPSAHVVGHSYGGMMGMWCGHEPWLDNPARCARVIVSFLDNTRAAVA